MKFEDIKVLFSDIDGTLTDGRLYYSADGEALKVFHVKDGMGIKNWQKRGFIFGLLSARKSRAVIKRAEDLGIEHLGLGIENKIEWMQNWLKENNLQWENIAYIGDDLNDLEIMKNSAFSAAPFDAVEEVKNRANFVAKESGGLGAVREVIDYMLKKKS
ncbi:MAG: HAD-IIIA family hydrolase [Spirochaetia bacterium]|nr:HAD-IIIA family hydrolase [Spirochaetia bacterium]